jgi:hypothetical protein
MGRVALHDLCAEGIAESERALHGDALAQDTVSNKDENGFAI